MDNTGSAKNGANGYIFQTITIPSSATSATLSFWLNITSDEGTSAAYDNLYVQVLNASGTPLEMLKIYSNLDKGPYCGLSCIYNQKTFDLSGYIGQTIQIRFLATTDTSVDTVFRIDDVSLMSN